MGKLNQILAVEKGLKQRVNRDLTELHKLSQKPDQYEGHVRTYEPINEDGETLPEEKRKVQLHSSSVLERMAYLLTELFDLTATKDMTNTVTSATVQVGDRVIAKNVPVSYLLFMEKQLDDIYTEIRKMPVLDPSVEWKWSAERNLFASPPQEKNRTEKVPEPVVLHPPTDKHPAQTKLEYRDRTIGYYKTIRFSAALPQQEKERLLQRVTTLKDAVKKSREEANMVEAKPVHVGQNVFDYILGR